MNPPNIWPRWMALSSAAVIAVATLVPSPDSLPYPCPTFTIWCGDFPTVDIVLNILLFIPFGAALRQLGLRVAPALALGAGLTVAIEVVQAFVPGRDPALRDVLANTIGTGAGFLLAVVAQPLFRPTPAHAARLLAGYSALLVLGSGLGATLLRPSAPASVWFGQWRADLQGLDRYSGSLIGAWLGEHEAESGRLAQSATLVDLVRAGRQVHTRVIATGPTGPTERLAPIFSVFDEVERKILIVGQRGFDLVFEARMKTEDVGLKSLTIRLPNALERRDTVEIWGHLDSGRLEAAIGAPGQLVRSAQRLTPLSLWRAFTPGRWPVAPPLAEILDGIVTALATLVAGAYGARATVDRRNRFVVVVAAAVSMILVAPLPFGMPLAPVPSWIGWVAGWATALALGGAARRTGLQSSPSRTL